MRNNNNTDYTTLRDANVYDADGDKLGTVKDVYLDDKTGEPTFVKVNTGFLGMGTSLIPVKLAEWTNDNDLHVPFDKAYIKDAPNVDADQHITPEEEQRIYEYYQGRQVDENWYDNRNHRDDDHFVAVNERRDVVDGDLRDERVDEQRVVDTTDHVDVDRDRRDDRDHVEGDSSMTLHEERLNVGTERVETGEAHLRKTVVTEQQTVEVPVEREEVHVVREPVNEVVGDAIGDDANEEVSMTLSEERPVVEKETVAVERVGLEKEAVQDTQRVSAEVAHEEAQIEREGEVVRDSENLDRDHDGRVDGDDRRDGHLDLLDKDHDGERLNDRNV